MNETIFGAMATKQNFIMGNSASTVCFETDGGAYTTGQSPMVYLFRLGEWDMSNPNPTANIAAQWSINGPSVLEHIVGTRVLYTHGADGTCWEATDFSPANQTGPMPNVIKFTPVA